MSASARHRTPDLGAPAQGNALDRNDPLLHMVATLGKDWLEIADMRAESEGEAEELAHDEHDARSRFVRAIATASATWRMK